MRHRIVWTVIILAGTLVAGRSLEAQSPHDEVKHFDIEPQSLESALLEFSEQADLQLVVDGNLLDGRETPGFNGEEKAEQVLVALLEDSDLVFRKVGATVAIARSREAAVEIEQENEKKERNEESIAQLQETDKQDEPAEPGASNRNNEDRPMEMSDLVVVGSRLRGMETASPVIVIDRQTIETGGYSNLDDVFQRLPQNLSTITPMSSDVAQQFEFAESSRGQAGGTPLGNSSINLRGIGSRSTLILVNGRRRAVSPNSLGGFTGISSIPLSQIERIEILMDGASAIYGADAVVGVVNIVLRKDYKGALFQFRHENSSTEGDLSRLVGGYSLNWDRGSATVSLDASRNYPVDVNKLIHVGPSGRGDLSDLGGINGRLRPHGTPGAVFEVIPDRRNIFRSRPGALIGLVPEGQDGANLLESELVGGDPNSRSVYERRTIGPEVEKTAGRLYVSQVIGESHELDLEVTYTEQKDEQFWRARMADFKYLVSEYSTYVPASNRFNRFGRDVMVSYSYENEFRNLFLSSENARENIDAAIGLSGDLPFGYDWKYFLGYNYGIEDGTRRSLGDNSGTTGRGTLSPDIRLLPILENLNVFGDGSDPDTVAANVALLDSLIQWDVWNRDTNVSAIEATLGGDLFDLPGGRAQLVFGMQRREDEINSQITSSGWRTSEIAPETWTRDVRAYFAELGLPLLAGMPGAEELRFTFALRREEIDQSGVSEWGNFYFGAPSPAGVDFEALTGVPLPPAFRNSGPVQGSSTFSSTPVIGTLSWKPTRDLRFRTTWGESFLAPLAVQQFNDFFSFPATRSFARHGLTLPPGFTDVFNLQGTNRSLQAQTAQTFTFGFDYLPSAIRGLDLRITYSKTAYDNYIGTPPTYSTEGRASLAIMLADIASFPEFFIPATNGVLVYDGREQNFADRTTETVDLQVDYRLDTGIGLWRLALNLQKTLELSSRVTPELPVIKFHDTERGPSDLAANLKAEWSRGPYRIASAVHYTSGHRVIDPYSARPSVFNDRMPNPDPQTSASSYTTVDLHVRYTSPASTGWLSGIDILLGAQNLFEPDFPFVDNFVGYSASRVNARGRVLYLELRKDFGG